MSPYDNTLRIVLMIAIGLALVFDFAMSQESYK